MDIAEYFDARNTEHIKAYKHLMEKGAWPKDFYDSITDIGITFSTIWHVAVLSKIAKCFIEDSLKNKDVQEKEVNIKLTKQQEELMGAFAEDLEDLRIGLEIQLVSVGEIRTATSLEAKGLVMDVRKNPKRPGNPKIPGDGYMTLTPEGYKYICRKYSYAI